MTYKTRRTARKTNNATVLAEQSLSHLVLAKLKNLLAPSEDRKENLKSLYIWLLYSSAHDFEPAADSDNHIIAHRHLPSLINPVFEELQRSLLVKLDDAFAGLSLSQSKVEEHSNSAIDELLLLLRCLMVALNGLEGDPNMLLDKSHYLLQMLHTMFSSSELVKKMFCNEIGDSSYVTDIFLEKPSPPLLCAMLEVFVDELLVHTNLRNHVFLSDQLHPARDSVLMCHVTDFGCVVEGVLAHFLVSVSLCHGCEDYFRSLAWTSKGNCPAPEISLTSAAVLFLNPVIASAPPPLLAHVMSVVSEVVISSDHSVLKLTAFNWYCQLFERAVRMYNIHMSSPDAECLAAKLLNPPRNHPANFWSQFESVTNDRVIAMLQEIDSSLGSSHCSSESTGTNCDRVSTLTEHVKENLCIIEESCRDEAFSFLSMLVNEASGKAPASYIKENIKMQELYMLASLLKLMTSSLLQAVRCSRNCSDSEAGWKSSKEYNFLVSLISSFRAYKICTPIQQLLFDRLEAELKHDGCKLMLVHLSGLLSFCLAEGLEVIAQDCVSLIMVLLNLLSEDTLNVLSKLVLVPVLDCCTGTESMGKTQSSRSVRKSSRKMASRFKQIQELRRSRDCHEPVVELTEVPEPVEVRYRTRSHFIRGKCDDSPSQSSSSDGMDVDDDDLGNFVESGPDLSSWLKSRAKYRKWKNIRIGKRTREKKKATWRALKRGK